MTETSKQIQLRSYAKINLCLDVPGILDNGYHEVNMIMQQILLCDEISLRWTPPAGAPEVPGATQAVPDAPNTPAGTGVPDAPNTPAGTLQISLNTNRPYLPRDSRNLAYKAAELMSREFGVGGNLRIDILKRIPVAAGLAGGSGNGGAVIHGLNQLWGLGLDVKGMCEIGSKLGSDVPFCIMGEAAEDPALKEIFKGDPLACHCAVATGTGTDLRPIKGLASDLVLSKPPISVSTAQAYQGIDGEEIPVRPNVEEMEEALARECITDVEKNIINVLENFTLKRYPLVVYTKNKMQELCNPRGVLMSGSGPTVFGLCRSREMAKEVWRQMKEINRESFWTRTTR